MITQKNFITAFRKTFPELEDKYKEESFIWGSESMGNYNYVAFVLKPYLQEKLQPADLRTFMQRLGSLMEQIFYEGDPEVMNVIWLKLFKMLLMDQNRLASVWPALGPLTRKNIKDAANRWGVQIPDTIA